jgi:hypothetical protein
VRESGAESNPQAHRRPDSGRGQLPGFQKAHAEAKSRAELASNETYDEEAAKRKYREVSSGESSRTQTKKH